MGKVLFCTLLGLALAALILIVPTLAQSPDLPALVRVDLTEPEDLARVDTLDLPIYAHLAVPGAEYLLGVLNSQQQEQLRSLGLSVTVLDPDARDASYYLIESGWPDMAEQVAPAFTIVHDDGRQAVGRLREGLRLQATDSLRVHVAGLGPDPIVLTPRVTGDIPTTPVYDPLIADVLAQVTVDTVAEYDGGLSGEWPVVVGGRPYVLTTRYTYSGEPIAVATQYVYEHLEALGYDVSYHGYTLSGYALRNVIGERQGLVYPDQIVLLTAHLDSRAADWPHNPAPGADDNASGSAALMIAADLLATLDFDYTIRIVFFTGEEQGMWGSYYYARDVANAGEDILGVLNLDMIAWDAKSGPAIDLHSHTASVEDDSDALADLFAAVVDLYSLDLEPQIVENGATFSDHSRFWGRGYAAIMAIEDYYNASEVPYEPRDWNPNYHTARDRLSTLNLAYFREYVRSSLATFVHLARPVPTVISGTVTGTGAFVPLSATVTAVGRDGVFSGATGVAGTYSLLVRPGAYTVTASALGYYAQTVVGVSVMTGTGTRVDFGLEPLPTFTVSGSVADAVSGLPLSATVRFGDEEAVAAPTGFYSATVFGGTYLVTVSASYHYPTTRTVVVDGDQQQDFVLEPTACVLVVDDDYDSDGNGHDDEVYYTAALEGLGVGYDLWRVADDADGPPLEVLRQYRGVVWLTGRDWDYTLTGADQDALAGYLDGGGRLFVSGQDIGWDIARYGEPRFYRDYLHADYLRDKSGYHELAGADFMSGVDVVIQGGDGANNQQFPSDVGVVGGGVGLFRYPDGDWGGIAYADGTYRVVYLAFGFEGIDSAAGRRAVMARILQYLAPCPLSTFTVSGSVVDAVSGLPLSATVRFGDEEAVAAPTGFYSATVFGGTYLVTVSASYHYSTTRTVVVDGDQRQDFVLEPTACVLVVDDDYDNKGNGYDDEVYYTAALEGLGVGYDLWRVADDADGPPLEVLRQYRGVMWLTGRDWDYTLTAADQDALAGYLDGGGRLFVSGQDIGWDIARYGEPRFYRDYLHADYLRDKSGYHELAGADFMSGVDVVIQGGDGANNQEFPSDVGVVGGGVGLFRYPDGDWGGIAYADGTYRVVYLAFGFEGIDSAAGRRAVMARILQYLAPCPLSTSTVSGSVVDAVSGLPLSATVRFGDEEAVAAPTGFYSATVFGGTYLVTVSASYHYPTTRTVVVDGDQQQDFVLEPTACVLVVDDDYDNKGNGYDDEVYYTAALEGLGVGYDLWRVADDADGPPLEVLRQYRGVMWLTGRDWDYTLTAADQDALAGYLDGGGRLFVSGQDIGWDIARYGEPRFYRDYLHADYLRDKSGYHELAGADFMSGVDVVIQGGDGANNQQFPSDVGVVGGGVGLFRYPDGDWGGIVYADGTYRVVYLAFGFEGIDSAAGRRAVMARILSYLAPCSPYNSVLSAAGMRFGEPGELVTHTVTIANIGTLGDVYDLALGAGTWTTTLPLTRSAHLLPLQRIDASLAVSVPVGAVPGDTDQFALTVTSAYSPAHTARVVLRTAVGHELFLPLAVRGWMSPGAVPDTKP